MNTPTRRPLANAPATVVDDDDDGVFYGDGDSTAVPARERPLSSYAHAGGYRWLGLLLLLLWVVVLWAMAIGKLVLSGAGNYFKYFTNWSWTLQALYYAADVACYADASGRAHRRLLGRPFWLVFGVVWIVFWLVFLMFGSNGEIIEQFAADAGVSVGVALIFDRIVHVVPALVVSLYAWHRWYGIAHGVWWIRHTRTFGTLNAAAFAVGDVYLTSVAFGLLYAVPINMQSVYGIDDWVLWSAPIVGLLTLTAMSGGAYVVASRHIYHLYPGHGHDMSSDAVVREMLISFGYPASHAAVLRHRPFWTPPDDDADAAATAAVALAGGSLGAIDAHQRQRQSAAGAWPRQ
jgi:hypothetical protein